MYARVGHDPLTTALATKTSNNELLTRDDHADVQLVFFNILHFKQFYTLQTAFIKAKQHFAMSADFDKVTLQDFDLWSTKGSEVILGCKADIDTRQFQGTGKKASDILKLFHTLLHI